MARCKACKQEVIWMVTKNDKKMLVNFDSLSERDILYLQTVDAEAHPILFRYGEHVSHFYTCPNADKFRKLGKHM